MPEREPSYLGFFPCLGRRERGRVGVNEKFTKEFEVGTEPGRRPGVFLGKRKA